MSSPNLNSIAPPPPGKPARFFLFEATPGQRRTLYAASLGWMLDAFDVMLYAMVLAHVMQALGMSKAQAGFLNTLTLLASGIGGILFGFIADSFGRKRALMFSVLTYSVCSFACGLTTTIPMLAFFRFVLGLGMGGEWSTGATLVAETWPTELRAKALSVVQGSWAFGYALAALTAGVVLHFANWRAAFFVGILPALLTLWIRRDVPESTMWLKQNAALLEARAATRAAADGGVLQAPTAGNTSFWQLFSPQYRRATLALLFMNFFSMFSWWGLFTWIPPYLSLSVAQGGRGLNVVDTTTLLVLLNLFGMFPGYVGFGWVADAIGRRKAFFLYPLCAAAMVPLYAMARSPLALLIFGTLVAFFGTGLFSGSGIVGSEVYPTTLRARGLGFTYNGARTLSALSPFIIGWIGQRHGLNSAFYLCAVFYAISAAFSLLLPETRGRQLA